MGDAGSQELVAEALAASQELLAASMLLAGGGPCRWSVAAAGRAAAARQGPSWWSP